MFAYGTNKKASFLASCWFRREQQTNTFCLFASFWTLYLDVKTKVCRPVLTPCLNVFCVATCWSRWGRGSSFLPLSCLHRHSPDKHVIHAHQDVLRFDVRVDDLTLGMQVVQTLQDLQTQPVQHKQVFLLLLFTYSRNTPPLSPSLWLLCPSLLSSLCHKLI